MKIPFITTKQMEKIEYLMECKYNIGNEIMMENAGRNFARFVQERANGSKEVVVITGPGNNGAAGLAAARYLHEYGISVKVISVAKIFESNLAMTGKQMRRLTKLGVEVVYCKWQKKKAMEIAAQADIIVDAIFGYNFKGTPRSPYDYAIKCINDNKAKVYSLDTPSGISEKMNKREFVAIEANATLSLGLPKRVLKKHPKNVGSLYVANIGVPRLVYEKMGIEVPNIFVKSDVVKV